jgi:hypothetical protein
VSLGAQRHLLDSLKRLLLRRAPDRYSRRWPRVAVEEHAQVRLSDGSDKPVIVNQISVGGARVQTTVQLRPGDNIELQLDNGVDGSKSILARIVYTLRENSGYYFACGLCFLGLRPHETQWIAAFIASEQARRRASASGQDGQAPVVD